MIIKKWNGSNAWTAVSPKVTFTDIVDDVGAGTPESIFVNNKLRIKYLPDEVFDSLRFSSTINPNSNNASVADYLQGAVDSAAGLTNRSVIGYYWVASTSGELSEKQDAGVQGGLNQDDYFKWYFRNDDTGDSTTTSSGTLESGDWIVVTDISGAGTSASPYNVELGVVNNVYEIMTGASAGVAGASGLVPAPASGSQGKYLRGDASWQTIAYSEISGKPDSLNDFNNNGNWKVFYSNGSGDIVELTTGADNTVLKGNGTTTAPSFGQVAYSEISGTPSLATVATTGAYSDLSGTPTLATVATSGSYNDLSNKPTIPSNATDLGAGNYKLFYSNGSGAVVELALGANNTVLKGEGTTSAPTFGQIAYSEISGTPTIPSAPNNATITISAGTGLQTGGDFTTDQATNETITVDMRYPVVYHSTTLPTTGAAVAGLTSGAIGFEG